jgi:hypothetical protein
MVNKRFPDNTFTVPLRAAIISSEADVGLL